MIVFHPKFFHVTIRSFPVITKLILCQILIGLIFFSFIDFFNDPFHKDFYLKLVSFHIEPRRRVHDVKFVSLFVVNFSLQEEESTKDTEH